jgi:hypothetical protein
MNYGSFLPIWTGLVATPDVLNSRVPVARGHMYRWPPRSRNSSALSSTSSPGTSTPRRYLSLTYDSGWYR